GFNDRGLVVKTASATDRRQSLLALTTKGRMAYATLDQRSQADVAAMMDKLSSADQDRVVAAMATIESMLAAKPAPSVPYILRPPRPGDMGWIVSRHGIVYGEEYGWDDRLEALTAEIVAAFVRNYDHRRGRCWVARGGGRDGRSGVVGEENDQGRAVGPPAGGRGGGAGRGRARGLGIGARLVDECVRFAREAGYRKITLWTHSVLTAARRIYEHAGFRLVETWRHDDFGKELVGENWDLDLRR